MKRIIIDMKDRMEHHLLSGNSFAIDGRLERLDGNIYLERAYTNHPSIASAHSVLIPALHLWVMFWQGHGGPHACRCYMHMAHIRDEGDRVTIDDLYLDVIVKRDGRWQVLDIDEFRAAIASGELTPDQIQYALQGLEHACRLVGEAGGDIERHVYDLLSERGA
ncbi:MAG TPA: DUF402 domain-containing protein [Symbiobacteriaceae bacterium]|nr:DUF402 domain-containing protein [Symbiobacteriaceae bacterium]